MATGSHYRVFTGRRRFVLAVFFLLTAALIGRLFYIQVISYDYYQSLVVDQVTVETKESAKRGEIYDTNMSALATNVTAWRVFISPRDIDRAEKKSSMHRSFLRFGASGVQEEEKGIKQS